MSIRYRRKRIYLKWTDFEWKIGGYADDNATAPADNVDYLAAPAQVLSASSSDGADQPIDPPADGVAPVTGTGPYGFFVQGATTGAPYVVGQATSAVTGFEMSTDTDAVSYFGLIPYDLDVRQNVGVRVVYTHGSATAADICTWTVLYDSKADDEVLIAPATALDTTIAAQTLTGAAARQLKRTARGIINIAAGTVGIRETDSFWSFLVTQTSSDVAVTEGLWFLGLEVDYVPRMTPNTFSVDMGSQDTRPLGD